jgi:hypothetical protein
MFLITRLAPRSGRLVRLDKARSLAFDAGIALRKSISRSKGELDEKRTEGLLTANSGAPAATADELALAGCSNFGGNGLGLYLIAGAGEAAWMGGKSLCEPSSSTSTGSVRRASA